MQEQPQGPIFIVGCPRSGTTLLQQMLDAHTAVAIAPETFFVEQFWLQRERYGDLERDVNFRQLIENIIALPEFEEMGLNSVDFRSAAWSNKRNYSSVFRTLLEQFANLRGAKIVGEKTPNHLLYMQTLQQFFPSARFIHIVRDPRAVVKSWQQIPWSTGSLAGDARVWRRYMATARNCTPSVKSSLFTLYYEQLVSEPEENLRALCCFLKLEYDPAMMAYHQRESRTVNTVREPWKVNATKPITQASLNRWQTELSPSMLAEIETVAWIEMKYFGYKPKTNLLQLVSANISDAVKRKLRESASILKITLRSKQDET